MKKKEILLNIFWNNIDKSQLTGDYEMSLYMTDYHFKIRRNDDIVTSSYIISSIIDGTESIIKEYYDYTGLSIGRLPSLRYYKLDKLRKILEEENFKMPDSIKRKQKFDIINSIK